MDTALLATELHQLEQQIVPKLHRAELLAEFPTPADGAGDTYVQRFLAELRQLLKLLGYRDTQADILFGGGGIGDQNRAWLSIIDESFSQVPEPSTLALSVDGGAILNDHR